ncbi:MAG: hypothetical protein HQM14_08715 [SAR324 cluster bacterium]|nr:hypothetical protein [SAR324 cluster bacterium]
MKLSRRKRKKKQSQPRTFNPEQISQYQNRAKQHLDAGLFQKAKPEIDNILKCDPKANVDKEMTHFLLLRGQHRLQRNDYHRALQDFEQMFETYGETENSYYFIAKCRVLLGQEAKASAFIQKAFNEHRLPDKHANLLLKLLLLQDQLEEVQVLLQNHPQRFSPDDLHWAKGVLALKQDLPQEATLCFNQAQNSIKSKDDRFACLQSWKAYSLVLEKRIPEAQAAIETIQDLPLKGWLYLHHSHHASSPETLQKAESFLPHLKRRTSPLTQLIGSLEKSLEAGDVHEAAHLLAKHPKEVSRLPNHLALEKSIYRLGAQVAFDEGALSCAETIWKKSLQLHPHDWGHYKNVIVQGWDSEFQLFPDWVKHAEKLLDIEAQKYPDQWHAEQKKFTSGELAGYLALHYLKNRHSLRAKPEIAKAFDKAPEAPIVLVLKGYLAFEKQQFQEAETHYQKALTLGCPMFEQIYDDLIEIYQTTGQFETLYQFRKKHGEAFADVPLSPLQIETRIYFAQAKGELPYLDFVIKDVERNPHLLINAAKMFLGASHPSQWHTRKKIEANINIKQLQKQVNAAPSEQEQIELLKYFIIAFDFYKKTLAHRKVLKYLQQELKQRAETNPKALLSLVQTLGALKKPPKEFDHFLNLLLTRSDSLLEDLVELQRFWFVLGHAGRCQEPLLSLLKKEPEHPSLLWAVSTLPLPGFQTEKFHQKGFDLARRLQDDKAFTLFRLKEELEQLEDEYEEGLLGSLFDLMGGSFEMPRYSFGRKPAKAPGNSSRRFNNPFGEEDEDEFDFSDGPSEDRLMDGLMSLLGMEPSFEDLFEELEDDPSLLDTPSFSMAFISAIITDPTGAKKYARERNMPRHVIQMIDEIIHAKKRFNR